MQERQTSRWILTLRFTLFAASILLVACIGYMFWTDARDGRDSRETERVQGSEEQVQGTPAAPLTLDAPPAPVPE